MSYNSDKKIEQLDILTSLATDDYLIAGDTSDSGRAKAITKANFTTDMGDETQTLTNKTIALGSNTVSGTLAEFNAALTGADFATGGGTATGTNTGDQTNISGNAATVTTNANLTGIVTSVGNATAIADKAISYTKLADGTDGELITWNSSGVAATVPVGTATHVLTSNGAGAAPTFQAKGFTSRARAFLTTSNQSVATATFTKITMNAETFDTDGEFDPVTNYRFTATSAGYYLVNASVNWVTNGVGLRLGSIYKNGSEYSRGTDTSPSATTGGAETSVSDIVFLAATDYIEVFGYQTSGGNLDVLAGSAYTFVSIQRLS